MSGAGDWADITENASVDAVKAGLTPSAANTKPADNGASSGAKTPAVEGKASPAASPKENEDESTSFHYPRTLQIFSSPNIFSIHLFTNLAPFPLIPFILCFLVDPEVELAAQKLSETKIDKEQALGKSSLNSLPIQQE